MSKSKQKNKKPEVEAMASEELVELEVVEDEQVSEAEADGQDEESSTEAQEMLVPAEQLAEVETERDNLKDQLLRARAEFDNYRKRTVRENEQMRKLAAQNIVRDMLPVVDNLDRALEHIEDKSHPLAEGMEMVKKQFIDVLYAHGVEPIEALGEAFDPNIHEALTHQPSEEYAADIVAVEFQRGYKMGGQVLRPSKVVVSSGPPDAAAETDDSQ